MCAKSLKESLKEGGYVSARRVRPGSMEWVLTDEDGKRELWFENPGHASAGIVLEDGTELEFVRDADESMIPEPRPWGRDDLMAIAAARYCLGRSTYTSTDCVDWLVDQWSSIQENARGVIRRDVEEAFVSDDYARRHDNTNTPFWSAYDRGQWERVRTLWADSKSPV